MNQRWTMTITLLRTSKTGYGVVDKAIAPHHTGRIKYLGSYWKAALADPNCQRLEVGEAVRVVGVQGITQLVVPEGYESSMQV
jgi:membrane protein implicated in regulation of membrane protease activity